jgi:hypothetical protein
MVRYVWQQTRMGFFPAVRFLKHPFKAVIMHCDCKVRCAFFYFSLLSLSPAGSIICVPVVRVNFVREGKRHQSANIGAHYTGRTT